MRTNEIQPRHEFLNPAPNPEKKTTKKTFGFVVMYSDFLQKQFDVHQVSTDVQDWMLATRRRRQVRVKSSSWERVELTVSVYLCVCVYVCSDSVSFIL